MLHWHSRYRRPQHLHCASIRGIKKARVLHLRRQSQKVAAQKSFARRIGAADEFHSCWIQRTGLSGNSFEPANLADVIGMAAPCPDQ